MRCLSSTLPTLIGVKRAEEDMARRRCWGGAGEEGRRGEQEEGRRGWGGARAALWSRFDSTFRAEQPKDLRSGMTLKDRPKAWIFSNSCGVGARAGGGGAARASRHESVVKEESIKPRWKLERKRRGQGEVGSSSCVPSPRLPPAPLPRTECLHRLELPSQPPSPRPGQPHSLRALHASSRSVLRCYVGVRSTPFCRSR